MMQYIREISVRYGKKKQHKGSGSVRMPADVASLVRKIVEQNGKEHFVMFCLDGSHSVVAYNVVSIGLANSAPVHPREVFQPAVLTGATAVVLAHNHPSGNVEPSQEDIKATRMLMDAANILGIKILDHVIVGDQAFYSMQEHGMLTPRKNLIG